MKKLERNIDLQKVKENHLKSVEIIQARLSAIDKAVEEKNELLLALFTPKQRCLYNLTMARSLLSLRAIEKSQAADKNVTKQYASKCMLAIKNAYVMAGNDLKPCDNLRLLCGYYYCTMLITLRNDSKISRKIAEKIFDQATLHTNDLDDNGIVILQKLRDEIIAPRTSKWDSVRFVANKINFCASLRAAVRMSRVDLSAGGSQLMEKGPESNDLLVRTSSANSDLFSEDSSVIISPKAQRRRSSMGFDGTYQSMEEGFDEEFENEGDVNSYEFEENRQINSENKMNIANNDDTDGHNDLDDRNLIGDAHDDHNDNENNDNSNNNNNHNIDHHDEEEDHEDDPELMSEDFSYGCSFDESDKASHSSKRKKSKPKSQYNRPVIAVFDEHEEERLAESYIAKIRGQVYCERPVILDRMPLSSEVFRALDRIFGSYVRGNAIPGAQSSGRTVEIDGKPISFAQFLLQGPYMSWRGFQRILKDFQILSSLDDEDEKRNSTKSSLRLRSQSELNELISTDIAVIFIESSRSVNPVLMFEKNTKSYDDWIVSQKDEPLHAAWNVCKEWIVNTDSNEEEIATGLNFMQFVDCIGKIALLKYSASRFNEALPRIDDKIAHFLSAHLGLADTRKWQSKVEARLKMTQKLISDVNKKSSSAAKD